MGGTSFHCDAILVRRTVSNHYLKGTPLLVVYRRGPRFLRSAVGKPLPDPYPKHSVVSRIMIVAASIVLGYSFIGLGAFLLFFMFGIHASCRNLLYTCAIALSRAFWVADRLVRPYDKPNDYRHWGTGWTTFLFVTRRDLDEFVRRRMGPTVSSIGPQHQF